MDAKVPVGTKEAHRGLQVVLCLLEPRIRYAIRAGFLFQVRSGVLCQVSLPLDPEQRPVLSLVLELLQAIGHDRGGHVRVGGGELFPRWLERLPLPALVGVVAEVAHRRPFRE